MVLTCSSRSALRRSVVLGRQLSASLLALAIAGCAGSGTVRHPAPPPGFSADTFTREGLISGATATQAACQALPDAIWARAGDSRQECIRFAVAGVMPGQSARVGIVYVPGDPSGAAYRVVAGLPQMAGVSEYYELSPETRRAGAEALSAAMGGLPVVNIARPGMHGSSGNHARDRHTVAEVALLDDALTQLRRRFGFEGGLVLVGFSSGGTIVANLMAMRDDIGCAVIASAPLDLRQFYRGSEGIPQDDAYPFRKSELADPIDSVSRIRSRPTIFVFGDPNDRKVPARAWMGWVTAARYAGLGVYSVEIAGLDRPELSGSIPTHHQTSSQALEAAYACARGVPPTQVLTALQHGEPMFAAHGQRLHGPEIRAAFAGHRFRGTEWYPRVNVLSEWGADGTLLYLDPRRGVRHLANLRWRIEDDRLCTSRHGCVEVIAEGRFLHLLESRGGRRSRLRATFVVSAPRG